MQTHYENVVSSLFYFGNLISDHEWTPPRVRIFHRLKEIMSRVFIVYFNPRVMERQDSGNSI